jgi:hypothetical protein
MNKLFNTQQTFQQFLLNGNPEVYELIIGTEKVSAQKRLSIYQNAYRLRLADALASNFPVLKVYLGDDSFAEVASEYIARYPSQFRSIRWYGENLPVFLSQHADYREYDFLCELAQFEWCLSLVFDAADSKVVMMEDVVIIPAEYWAEMRLVPHPSVHRIDLTTNAVQIWQDISEEKTPHEPSQYPDKINWIVWRHNLVSHFNSLENDEAWAIDAMQKGLSFNDICEGLCKWHTVEYAGVRAASLLRAWIQAGLISEILFQNNDPHLQHYLQG